MRLSSDTRSVAVLGGGVAGLTAAHELAERGYRVTVYERNDAPGGKARSMDVPGTGTGGRLPLPGEHGFRFFPGFYRNLPDTLRRIPYPNNSGSVHGNLTNATECLVARYDGRPNLRFPVRKLLSLPARESLLPGALVESLTGLLDTALNPATVRSRPLPRPSARPHHQLRAPADRAVGEGAVVGIHPRRRHVTGVSAAARRRDHSGPCRRSGRGGEHAHRRPSHPGVHLQPARPRQRW